MPRIQLTAAVALALAAASPAAYAQTATTHDTRAVANEALPQSIQPDEMRASKMIGSAVYDVQNRKIGSVDDVILNKAGKVDAVVIDVGSFSEWEARTSRFSPVKSRPTTTG